MNAQSEFDFRPRWFECQHRACFSTLAFVPAGNTCSDCGALVLQYIPLPPEKLGYLSAEWQWKLDGKPWTTREAA